MKIPGQKIVLTGAASGIGKALLRELAAYPARIVAADIAERELQSAIADLDSPQAQVLGFYGDLSQQAQIDRLFAFALEKMGGITLFFANAGFAYYERMETPDWERLERIYQTNVLSPLYSAQKMNSLNGTSPYRVVVTASSMGLLSIPGYTAYASTKAALHRFAEGYRFELADPNAVTLVYPISTRTGFAARASNQPPALPWPVQSPEHVAKAILRGVRRDQKSIYPSRLFQTIIFLDRFQPFLRKLIQHINLRAYQKWLAEQEKRP